MIVEDWERMEYLDEMYKVEKEMEIEEEWRRWLEIQEQEPAKITVLKLYSHENSNITREV
jgi:hypothetical protein